MPGLLMDLDGTMADTLPHLFRSFRHAVEPMVTRLPSDEEIVATFGPPEKECIAKLLADRRLAPAGAIERLDEAHRRFHAHYEGRHEEVKPFAGIPEVVRWVREIGWRFGVFTGKGQRSAVFTLERFALWEATECLVSGEDVARPKPDPEGVHLAARKLGLPVEQLIVVGDTPADVEAGTKAGARTVAALWGAFDANATRASGPTWVCETVGELRRLVEGLIRQP